jgi:hypothetical protein
MINESGPPVVKRVVHSAYSTFTLTEVLKISVVIETINEYKIYGTYDTIQ